MYHSTGILIVRLNVELYWQFKRFLSIILSMLDFVLRQSLKPNHLVSCDSTVPK